MKLLFLVQNFRQGWGGAPESVRLMARRLAPHGVTADVFDLGRVHRDVGALTVLPRAGAEADPFDFAQLDTWDAVLVAGPWQRGGVASLLARRKPGQPLYYLPRGGLARAEFTRPRDLKKLPYLLLVENRIVRAARGVIYSSEAERGADVWAAAKPRRAYVIPDFVEPIEGAAIEAEPPAERRVTFAFLAEISPRKGLLPLVEAFQDFAIAHRVADQVRLIVGGAPRPGSEAYLAAARAAAKRPDGAAVEFRGPIAHDDRAGFYGETDVLALSSRFESFGLTAIEAPSRGCVLLACPQIGALEYLGGVEDVVRAKTASRADLATAVAGAFALSNGSAGAQRARRKASIAQAIEAINARATGDWMQLLNPTPVRSAP